MLVRACVHVRPRAGAPMYVQDLDKLDRHSETQTDRHTDRHRQTQTSTDRQTDTQTDKDRQTSKT